MLFFLGSSSECSALQGPNLPSDSIYVTADTKPYFPGCSSNLSKIEHDQCSQKHLFQWVSKQLKYPENARDNGIQGSVIVSFVVNKDGSTSDVQIIKDPGGGLGDEAVRIISLMKEEIIWTAATKNATPVRFRYIMPIKFRLGDTKETYLVFKAWGGREVFRGMVDVAVQDRIPFEMIKNIETLDFNKSKIIYDVIGKVNIIHFRPKKLARPQELIGLKPSNIDKMPFNNVQTRFVKELDQLNISIERVDEKIKYYVHSYVGEVYETGSIKRSNGTIEKIKLPQSLSGVMFISFVSNDRYYTSLFVKDR